MGMDMGIYPYPYSIPIKYWVRLYADPTYYNIEKIFKRSTEKWYSPISCKMARI
jgi:hypothetical protein